MDKIKLGIRLLAITAILTLSACSSVSQSNIAKQSNQFESTHQKPPPLTLYTLLKSHESLATNNITLLAQNSTSDSDIDPENGDIETNSETTSIAEKLSDTDFSSPQLIVTEADFILFLKPNPYSSQVTNIKAGDGIYILSFQDGWYEVETLDNQHGFINANRTEVNETEAETEVNEN